MSTFSEYFAQKLIAEKGYGTELTPELEPLRASGFQILVKRDFSFAVIILVDRERNSGARFTLSQDALLAMGKECLKYTGRVGSNKMPVAFQIYEIGQGGSVADWTRLKALHRLPGFAKVQIAVWQIDTLSKRVRSSVLFNGRLAGRRWIERLLVEPRLSVRETTGAAAVEVGASPGRRPWGTLALLGVLVAVLGLEYLFRVDEGIGWAPSIGTLVAMGGNVRPLVAQGEWYRLFSAALLHADPIHLVCNGVALWMAGVILEPLLGTAWFFAVFFLGSLGGGLASLGFNDPHVVSVGASGAIMGLFATALLCSSRMRAGRERTVAQTRLMQVFIPSLIPLVTAREGGHVDFAAHFGGAIAGAVTGFALLKAWRRGERVPRGSGFGTLLAVSGLVVFALSVFSSVNHYPEYRAEFQKLTGEEAPADLPRQ